MRRVVIVTDGDQRAVEAVEIAAKNAGARCISISGGRHPKDARWTPQEIEELILSTPKDPVVVLVDDEGREGEGPGEHIVKHLKHSDKIKVVGIVAVASDLKESRGARVDVSVRADGSIVPAAVDKDGRQELLHGRRLKGDTVENLDRFEVPIVVGMGDPGKMSFADDARIGAPLTTKAIKLALAGRRDAATV